jgi:DNA-binding response OmpR family regulator
MASIFIADDDPLVIELIEFKLKRLGHKISSAQDGEAALHKIRQELPDLIIMDYMLPILSASEVIQELRKTAATGDIPIIILTAAWREQDIMDALDQGIADIMTKPFSPAELLMRIARILAANPKQKVRS